MHLAKIGEKLGSMGQILNFMSAMALVGAEHRSPSEYGQFELEAPFSLALPAASPN